PSMRAQLTISSGNDSCCWRSQAVSRSAATATRWPHAFRSSTSKTRVASSGSTTSTFMRSVQSPTSKYPKPMASPSPWTLDVGPATPPMIRVTRAALKRTRDADVLVEDGYLAVLHPELHRSGLIWEEDIDVGTPHAMAGV